MQMPKSWIAAAAVCLVVGGVGGAAITYKLSNRNLVPSASASAPGTGASADAMPYQDGVTPVGDDIGPEGAKAAALNHAGLAAEAVTGMKVESDWDNGRLVYEVEFQSGSIKYEYTIEGATGKVLKVQQESPAASGTPGIPVSPVGDDIGTEGAQAAALAHAGLAADGVTGMKVEPDRKNGRLEYEVEFRAGQTEYEVTVDGSTGKVVEYEKKAKTAAPAAPAGGDIGAEGAQAAALADAGLSAGEVTGMKVEPDRDNGRLAYEVEFWSGNSEYEYTIDGATGSILEYKKEDHVPTAGGNGYIGEEAARQVALTHAGVADSAAQQYSCTVHHADGHPHCYQVQFDCGNSHYEYEIGLYDGAVLHHGCQTYQSQSHHTDHHSSHHG